MRRWYAYALCTRRRMASAMLNWLRSAEVESWYAARMECAPMGLALKMMRQDMMRQPRNVYPNHSPKAILRSVRSV